MSLKQQNEELKKEVEKLKQHVDESGQVIKRLEKELKSKEAKYSTILNEMDVTIGIIEAETFLSVAGNDYLPRLLGYSQKEFQKISPAEFDLLGPEKQEDIMHKVKTSGSESCLTKMKSKNGEILDVLSTYKVIHFNEKDYFLVIGQEVTELKDIQRKLQAAHEEMSKRVEERTAELSEMNTALKVMLRQRDEEKRELEDSVITNLKEFIEPVLAQLKHSHLNKRQYELVEIIENQLKDVTSPFLHRLLSKKYSLFTPREIEIANYIKSGKTTKEMAELINVEISTIEHHRKNIRKKLGLKSKSANLRSRLLSFDEP